MAGLLIAMASQKGIKIATAESCTGGLIAGLLTEIPGSSAVFTHGFITYADAAKRDLLGVPQAMLDRYGAVSEEVARTMAEGARRVSGADMAVSVTGVAGPGGGSDAKPVGLVHMAVSCAEGGQHSMQHFSGNRGDIRLAAMAHAVRMLHAAIEGK
jgi:PncC family amidohydrolase